LAPELLLLLLEGQQVGGQLLLLAARIGGSGRGRGCLGLLFLDGGGLRGLGLGWGGALLLGGLSRGC